MSKNRIDNILPDDDKLLKRVKIWSEICEKYKYDNWEVDIYIKDLRYSEFDKQSNDDSNESIEQFEDKSVPDEEQDPDFDVQKTLNDTLQVVQNRESDWRRIGIDKAMIDFDVKIAEKVYNWFATNESYYNKSNYKRKPMEFVNRVFNDHNQESSSDLESLQSVNTAKYILSNRKKVRSSHLTTMTIKQFCFSNRKKNNGKENLKEIRERVGNYHDVEKVLKKIENSSKSVNHKLNLTCKNQNLKINNTAKKKLKSKKRKKNQHSSFSLSSSTGTSDQSITSKKLKSRPKLISKNPYTKFQKQDLKKEFHTDENLNRVFSSSSECKFISRNQNKNFKEKTNGNKKIHFKQTSSQSECSFDEGFMMNSTKIHRPEEKKNNAVLFSKRKKLQQRSETSYTTDDDFSNNLRPHLKRSEKAKLKFKRKLRKREERTSSDISSCEKLNYKSNAPNMLHSSIESSFTSEDSLNRKNLKEKFKLDRLNQKRYTNKRLESKSSEELIEKQENCENNSYLNEKSKTNTKANLYGEHKIRKQLNDHGKTKLKSYINYSSENEDKVLDENIIKKSIGVDNGKNSKSNFRSKNNKLSTIVEENQSNFKNSSKMKKIKIKIKRLKNHSVIKSNDFTAKNTKNYVEELGENFEKSNLDNSDEKTNSNFNTKQQEFCNNLKKTGLNSEKIYKQNIENIVFREETKSKKNNLNINILKDLTVNESQIQVQNEKRKFVKPFNETVVHSNCVENLNKIVETPKKSTYNNKNYQISTPGSVLSTTSANNKSILFRKSFNSQMPHLVLYDPTNEEHISSQVFDGKVLINEQFLVNTIGLDMTNQFLRGRKTYSRIFNKNSTIIFLMPKETSQNDSSDSEADDLVFTPEIIDNQTGRIVEVIKYSKDHED